MMPLKYLITYVCILLHIFVCNCFEPFVTTAAIIGIASTGAYFYDIFRQNNRIREECDENWNKFDGSSFDAALHENLYGQHLVKFVVTRSLNGHVQNRFRKKPLVMSFHGWTGSGKNHVSQIIVDNLYKTGDFAKLYVATKDFPHEEDVKIYRDKLQNDIKMHTRRCAKSIFIFDEVDKMEPGILDALKPYLDHYNQIDGIDYRNNIFIFLSNAGGNDVAKVAMQFWRDGKEREHITMKDVEPLISRGVFNEKGGLYRSEIVTSNLIDVFVPFLPLERRHVKMCIQAEVKKRGRLFSTTKIDEIADQLIYYPQDLKIYSESGCKKIAQKIDVYGD